MKFKDYVKELITTLEFSMDLHDAVENSGDAIITALRNGNKVLTCGNGGSAADAMHLSEELLGKYKKERVSLPSTCLCADPTTLTCIGNDFGFDQIFARQVEGLGNPGDVIVGFSTSGTSPNVLNAMEISKEKGLVSILLTSNRYKKKDLATYSIAVPSNKTERIQEVHTLIFHSWLEKVDISFG